MATSLKKDEMTLPASFTAGASLPILLRGVPLTFIIRAVPPVVGMFTDKIVAVHLDSESGVRITLTEQVGTGTGTFEATGLTVSADGSEVTANLEDTDQLEDGTTYKIVLILEIEGGPKESIGPWDLPVRTMPGGII